MRYIQNKRACKKEPNLRNLKILQSKGTRNKVKEKIRYQRVDLIKGDIL